MTDPLPEWMRQTPNLESLHNLPDIPWGGYRPRDIQLPSLPDLALFVAKMLERFLKDVVLAVVGFFVPGDLGAAYEQLKDWATNLSGQVVAFIDNVAGIDLSSWDGFLASLNDGKGIDLPLIPDLIETISEWVETLVDMLLGALGGDPIGTLFDRIFDLADTVGDWLLDTQAVAGDLANLASALLMAPATVIGTITQSMVPAIGQIVNAIFNGWFGGGGTGNVSDVQYTIETIKDAVINGYTVTTFTSDETNWAVPAGITEMTAILIGGGNGGNGGGAYSGGQPGGTGGAHGSFLVQALDVESLPSHLDIKIGAGGSGGSGNTGSGGAGGTGGLSYVREANTATPHTGTVIVQSAPQGSGGGISTTFGYTTTASLPGSGGNGGTGSSVNTFDSGGTAGTAGQPSAAAPGGAGGAAYSGGGQAGGNVSAGAVTKCGGGGGGGGGGGHANGAGNPGGAGGYPGGGGGGGGTAGSFIAFSANGGAGGNGAPGVVWLFYR